MKPNIVVLALALVVLLAASAGTAQEKEASPEQLGRAHLPVSCSAAAQRQFDRAIALLHSFWFDAAANAFAQVTGTDPTCAMGHWGTAMTRLGNPFAWPPAPNALQEGWAAVERAKAVGAKTQRERDYIGAIERFYRDAEARDHRTRALAYEQAMEALYRRYPEDREAAIFYALALNATAPPTDKTYANQLKAAEILEKVFGEQPNHPGVAHYLIHSYDYPPLSSRGLPAARRYARIAPSAPHALHMPSHIFTRLGLWQDSIASNRDSATAARNHFDKLHAMDYLVYAYLQGTQDRAALRIVEQTGAIQRINVEHFVTAYALAAIPARYMLERRRWSDAASLEPQPKEFPWHRFPQAEAVTYFSRALGAARSGAIAGGKKDLERLQELRAALREANQGYWADQVEIQHRAVAAWLARAAGNSEEAVELARSAAALESASEKHPVTPGPILPTRELLGELLLELNRPAAALVEFEASIEKEPNRFNGLYDAARAAELVGDLEQARTFYTRLVALCEHADVERPELEQAKAFLAKK